MIVSGYFLSTNEKIKFAKVFDLLIIVVFYRLFDFICTIIFLHEEFTLHSLISCFLPANYFAIFYVICYMLSPFIAKVFREISNRTATILISLLLVIFILIPTFLDIAEDMNLLRYPETLSPISSKGNCGGYSIVQFLVMLSLGMWIRKIDFNPSTWKLLLVYLLSSLAIFICQKKISAYGYDFIFNVTSAASLFLLFKKLTIQNKAINFASKSCFAIFCLHTGVFANTIWKKYFITSEHIQNGLGLCILWTFVSVAFMFVICLLISFTMRGLFSKIKDLALKRLPVLSIEDKNPDTEVQN